MSTVRKMGDLKPVSDYSYAYPEDFDRSNFYFNFYDGEGSQRKLGNDPWIMANCPKAATDYPNGVVQIYWDGEEEGWFLTCDSSAQAYPMANYPLDNANGFLESVGSDFGEEDETEDNPGVKLTFSGSVDKLPTPVKAINTKILTGNMTPVTVKLSEITVSTEYTYAYPEDFDRSNFYLNFYDGEGSQRKLKDDPWIMANCPKAATDYPNGVVQIYWDGEEQGWFLTCDSNAKAYPMANYELKSGDGFLMNVGSDFGEEDEIEDNPGVTLTIPAAIED